MRSWFNLPAWTAGDQETASDCRRPPRKCSSFFRLWAIETLDQVVLALPQSPSPQLELQCRPYGCGQSPTSIPACPGGSDASNTAAGQHLRPRETGTEALSLCKQQAIQGTVRGRQFGLKLQARHFGLAGRVELSVPTVDFLSFSSMGRKEATRMALLRSTW